MVFEDLLGETIVNIEGVTGDDEMIFTLASGIKCKMYHYQDCCESVWIEDVIGELTDLLDSPILMAEEVSEDDESASESGTWTFYKLATIKGYVTIRWYGESNGYYSEDVSFTAIKSPLQ